MGQAGPGTGFAEALADQIAQMPGLRAGAEFMDVFARREGRPDALHHALGNGPGSASVSPFPQSAFSS